MLAVVQKGLAVPTWAAAEAACRPARCAYLAGEGEEAPHPGLAAGAEHAFGRRMLAGRGRRLTVRRKPPRLASLAAVEVEVDPGWTRLIFPVVLRVHISRRPVWAAAQQSVALAAKVRAEESVLVGCSPRI